MIATTLLSVILYALTIVLLKSYLNVNNMDWAFFAKVALMSGIVWIPPFIIQKLISKFLPSDYEKVMRGK